MAEITLKKSVDKALVPFVVNLENEETGATETYRYFIKRLGGKAAMQVNLMLAEFARDKNRDALLGSSMMSEILKRTTKDPGTKEVKDGDTVVTAAVPPTTLELIDIFDNVDDKGLEQLTMAMVNAAKSASTEE